MSSKIVVIIPCYNEANRLNVPAFHNFLSTSKSSEISICFIDDGSKDKTWKILDNLRNSFPNRIQLIKLNKNQGKAEAIRQAMIQMYHLNEFENYVFMDADLSVPLSALNEHSDMIETTSYKMIAGIRVKRAGARIKRSLARHLLGRIFATLTSIMLKLPVYDTQCGFKAFKHKEICLIFSKPFLSQWIFDVEIYFRFRQVYDRETIMQEILEYPLNEWREVKGSKLRFQDYVRIPFELAKLKYHYSKTLK